MKGKTLTPSISKSDLTNLLVILKRNNKATFISHHTHVTQSQANKNYWAAFVIWQKKVADAMARLREEELARKRAEEEKRAKPPQQPKPSKSQLLALLIGITVLFAVLSLIPPSPPKPPYGQPEHPKTGELVNQNIGDGCSGVMTICNYGGGGGGGSVIILFDLFYKVATNFVSGSLSILTQFVKQVAVQSVMDAIQDAIVDEILEQELEQDDDDKCNPELFSLWWNSLPLASPGATSEPFIYEAQVARGVGTMGTARVVPAPGGNPPTVAADGASSHNCFLIDAKYSHNIPAWRDDGFAPILNALDDLLVRYRLAILSNPQVMGLEIRTNSPDAKSYFERRLIALGFSLRQNAFVTIYPFIQE